MNCWTTRSDRGTGGLARASLLLLLVGVIFGGTAASAIAEPTLSVDLSHTPETMPRNFEQLDYRIAVANVTGPSAPAETGQTLSCVPGEWLPGPKTGFGPTLTYEWRRNGVPIPGQTGTTYVVAAADAGSAVQCVVAGTNVKAKSKAASLNPVPVLPSTASSILSSESPKAEASRPAITPGGNGLTKRTCSPPVNWVPKISDPSPPTYAFRWLRNGEEIAGATAAEYQPTAADEGKVLQCEVLGTMPGGTVVGISFNMRIGIVDSTPVNEDTPTVPDFNTTSGLVTVELALPQGLETRAFRVTNLAGTITNESNIEGWACTRSEPSVVSVGKVKCTTSKTAAPGSALPTLRVITSVGSDAPEPLLASVNVSGGGSEPAADEDTFEWQPALPFEIEDFEASAVDDLGADETQAGGHPHRALAEFSLQNTYIKADSNGSTNSREAIEFLKSVVTDLPAGFIGNPEAVTGQCPSVEAMARNRIATPQCPPGSAVGGIRVEIPDGSILTSPIYLLTPEDGVPAQLGFVFKNAKAIYTLAPRLRADDGYALSVEAPSAPKQPPIVGAEVTLCGYGAVLFEFPNEELDLEECLKEDAPNASAKPFLTNPTRCLGVPDVTTFSVDTWDKQGARTPDGRPDLADPDWHTTSDTTPPLTGCESVPFSPTVKLQPTSQEADSPTGLDATISVPTLGLESAKGVAQSALKGVEVELPAGMSVNPSNAQGLQACSLAEIRLGTNEPVACPTGSRIGSARVETPLLDSALNGSLYLARQGANPFGTLLALYLVVESKERGILVKIPGKVEPQPDGRLIATFDDNPQVPFSKLEVHIDGGERAPLLNPPRCGTYAIRATLSPWSAANPDSPTSTEVRTSLSAFDVVKGPSGEPCPDGRLAPQFKAGVVNPVAGTTSPFVLSISRNDGTQRFNGLEMTLPKGLTAYLRGVAYCPDAVLAGISGAQGAGAAELASPSCPAASQIGTVSVGAGGGPRPIYVDTGKAYLAGPYKGAPLSIAIVTPAVAGPFDLGNVVVRSAAYVDPETAQITVKSDPIPTILHGIPLDVRDIRVNIDRPGFTRAPTSCEESAVTGRVGGADGAIAPVSNRFQVGDCGNLAFGPKLKLEYKGQTKRTGNPALRAVLTQPGGQANISRTVVILPLGSFIDNAHINNPCTRAQYAAGACPKSSILGKATAWSPLLDEPLTGNVYFRSNGGERKLPDVVASLRGQVSVELVGFVDAIENKKAGTSRVRNTFAVVPDAPVSKFELNLKGGKVGLIENSKNLCKQKNVATVKMAAHNGLTQDLSPVVKTSCGKKSKKKR